MLNANFISMFMVIFGRFEMSMLEHAVLLSRRRLLQSGAAAAATLTTSSLLGAKTLLSSVPVAAAFQAPTRDKPIRIQFNENPLGMSAKAQAAAVDSIPLANRYPFAEIEPFRKILADHHRVPADNILLTAGSSDAIRASIAAFATPATQFVIPELTYGDGEFFAKANKLKIVKVPSDRNTWAIDLAGMRRAVAAYNGPSIVYLVNPNNPTSTIVPSAEVARWIRSKPRNTVFIVDEAYAEFVNSPDFRSADSLVAAGLDNVLVLKTFSKIHAMAGMRVGYIVGKSENISKISIFIENDSMTLSYPSVTAATASMQDAEFLAYSKKSNDEAKAVYTGVLKELGLSYLPSETNFVFHRLNNTSLETFTQRMRDANIIVGRPFPPAEGWCRVSMGTPDEMRYVAGVMRDFRTKGWV